jgi:hypothetical protein
MNSVNFKSHVVTTLLVVLYCLSHKALALSATGHQIIADEARKAQEQCFKQMYRDTNAYAQCVRDMRNAQARSPLKKLGIEYFGFVGALSYARVGHMNSSQIAGEFLKDFRQTQKQVGISDGSLCATIAGDCTVRIAQTREMEAAPPKQTGMRVQCINRICSMVPAE